jgi:acyl-CoA thioester hydrolase
MGRAGNTCEPSEHDPLTYRGMVYPWKMEHMDPMKVQHYVSEFAQSSWVLLAMLGLDSQYFRENDGGIAL